MVTILYGYVVNGQLKFVGIHDVVGTVDDALNRSNFRRWSEHRRQARWYKQHPHGTFKVLAVGDHETMNELEIKLIETCTWHELGGFNRWKGRSVPGPYCPCPHGVTARNCADCLIVKNAAWYSENCEHAREYSREYRRQNRERIRRIRNAWRAAERAGI